MRTVLRENSLLKGKFTGNLLVFDDVHNEFTPLGLAIAADALKNASIPANLEQGVIREGSDNLLFCFGK